MYSAELANRPIPRELDGGRAGAVAFGRVARGGAHHSFCDLNASYGYTCLMFKFDRVMRKKL